MGDPVTMLANWEESSVCAFFTPSLLSHQESSGSVAR